MDLFRKYLTVSVSTFCLLSPVYAMDEDWETDPDLTHHSLLPSSISANQKEQVKDGLRSGFKGEKPSSQKPPVKVGKIKIPPGLLGVGAREDAFIPVPPCPADFVFPAPPPPLQIEGEEVKRDGPLPRGLPLPPSPLEENRSSSSNTSSSNNAFLPSSGAENPPTTQASSSSGTQPSSENLFEEKTHDEAYRDSIFKTLGIEASDDNVASYFFTEEDLHERLINNFHGPELVLNKGSFLSPKSLLIFDALRAAKSIKKLSLEEARFNASNFAALLSALAENQFIKEVDLTHAQLPEGALSLLALSLKEQKTLRGLSLKLKGPFKEGDIRAFYKTIVTNTGLRFIHWPETVERDAPGLFESKERPAIQVLEDLAKEGNRVAAFHVGVFLTQGDPPNIKLALKYLQSAHAQDHPQASYELGKLKQCENNVQDALLWYQKAVVKDYPPALLKLGEYHYGVWPKGEERTPDENLAVNLFEIAKNLESPKAYYRLGRVL